MRLLLVYILDLHMKKALTIAFMAANLFVLGGCSSMLEASYGLGVDKPADAPAGWASNREGLRYEREGNFDSAKIAFCNAAELGHPEAKMRCEKYTLIEAAKVYFNEKNSRYSEIVVCSAKEYGPTAKSICEKGLNGQDIGPRLMRYVQSQQSGQQKVARPVTQQQQQPRQNTSPVRKAVPRSAPVATDLIGDL